MQHVWRELASEIGLQVFPPSPSGTLEQAETAVGCPLPDALRALLLETDGLTDEYGLEVVFSAERLAAENLMMRSNADFPAL